MCIETIEIGRSAINFHKIIVCPVRSHFIVYAHNLFVKIHSTHNKFKCLQEHPYMADYTCNFENSSPRNMRFCFQTSHAMVIISNVGRHLLLSLCIHIMLKHLISSTMFTNALYVKNHTSIV